MIDRFNRNIEYARISLTDRCNLRCQYCMPEAGVTKMRHSDILTLEEILTVVKILAALGIRKVRLTGGEPLLRKGIVKLIGDIKSVDGIEQVMLTTNGVLLDSMAEDLINTGLDGINLSLDTLDADIFNSITRRNLFVNVKGGLDKILNSGVQLKINCVPIAGLNDSDILKIVTLAKSYNIKVRFIELMPIGEAVHFKGIATSALKSLIESQFGSLIPHYELRISNYPGPATYFSLSGFKGQIGFIDALEHKYCASCNRVRLTSDGFLKLCLNSNAGLDVKALLRSGADERSLSESIQQAIYNKPKEHHFNAELGVTKSSNMYQIGG